MTELKIEQLDPVKLPLVKTFYRSYYPSGKAKKNEHIFVEYLHGKLIAVVRFRPIDSYHLLTGMVVSPEHRHQGIASQLLMHCQTHILDKNTYCFAYEHLEPLYKKAGFTKLQTQKLPDNLQNLLLRYTKSGKKLLAMQYNQN